MNRIIDFEKFKEQCATYDKATLRVLLFDWAFQRTLHELVLVNAINNCHADGTYISKDENIANLDNTIQGERILINLLGRKEAARVYGKFEGITSDVKTVDYVLNTDFVSHYKSLDKS